MRVVYGSELSLRLKGELKEKLLGPEFKRKPKLAIVLAGDNPASLSYVKGKGKACEEVGMDFLLRKYPEDVREEELLQALCDLNHDDSIDGIIVQLPLPKHINEQKVINAISPDKDVDGFTPINIGRMVLGEDCFVPATPMGICTLLQRYGIETVGKHCVVIGRSNIVGTPVANLLSRKGFDCTVTMCHSKTQNLKDITRQADILVVAIGKPEFITADMVKEGAVVVDVGIHRVEDATKKNGYRVIGDVKHSEVDAKCSWVTPVPGGVGPLTIVSLLQNTLKAYKKSNC